MKGWSELSNYLHLGILKVYSIEQVYALAGVRVFQAISEKLFPNFLEITVSSLPKCYRCVNALCMYYGRLHECKAVPVCSGTPEAFN